MTHKNLVVYIVFVFSFPTTTLEVDNIDNVSQELIDNHYDCIKKQDNRKSSLKKLAECNILPENLYNATVTITLYREIYSNDMAATTFSVKVHVFRYNCGMFTGTFNVLGHKTLTCDMIFTLEMYRFATKKMKSDLH